LTLLASLKRGGFEMQTHFSAVQLVDPAIRESESIIRKCVHCGFCTATCPTYVLLGDELDSPRGRIYLLKDMLENQREPTADVVKHIDRCLSCLSCTTTCPSGVDYMHLIDHGRAYIEQNYQRPVVERFYRALLAAVLPYQSRFRWALRLALLGKPFAGLMQRYTWTKPLAAMLALAPTQLPARVSAQSRTAPASKGRVLIQQGCAEPVLRPEYRRAAISLLNRAGYDVMFASGEGCCGALVQHMGKVADAKVAARRNVDAWMNEIKQRDVAAIIVTASGCGTTLKDYGHLLKDDPVYAEAAAKCASLARDINEFLMQIELPQAASERRAELSNLTVAYHAACSLQHGQAIGEQPKALLEKLGITVKVPVNAHLCCGSAGTYNIMQPELSGELAARKNSTLTALDADLVATTNIGCAVQMARVHAKPVVHVLELVDWATGGQRPERMDTH